MHEFKTRNCFLRGKTFFFGNASHSHKIVEWKNRPLRCRKNWRSDTQPYSFFNLSVHDIVIHFLCYVSLCCH